MYNLMEFGLNSLHYANAKSCYKNFIKKFNEYFSLDENNNSGTKNELIIFSFISSKKEIKEWAMQQVITIFSSSTEEVNRETIDITQYVPRVIIDDEIQGILNND